MGIKEFFESEKVQNFIDVLKEIIDAFKEWFDTFSGAKDAADKAGL